MADKIVFSRLGQLREYASQRTGGDKPFKDKSNSEKAWCNILQQVDYHEAYALDCVCKMADVLKTTRNTTQAGIYGSVAERIEKGKRNHE